MTSRYAKIPAGQGELLLPIARASISTHLGNPMSSEVPKWANGLGACFVTLTLNSSLRGCIGSLVAHRPLVDDIKANAINAAVRDYRFLPLTLAELEAVKIEVSVLSQPVEMEFSSREDLESQLRPGMDGLVLSVYGRRGTFLPQVWEQLPEPKTFINHLLAKAGLPKGTWDGLDWANDVAVERYTVEAWEEGSNGK